ncbi:serine/threonine-protein kinase [Dactylosporangium darangshiense]|uniref:Protein kinase domain-containing protein n=1 Tax=Dactylosporangium darangshiense TaxID=579108 RepID=A0ABP8DMY2_9ACTN
MDAGYVDHLRSRLRDLEIAGSNIIGGGGPPDTLRYRYLGWRDEVERFLTDQAHRIRLDLSPLQGVRHRDLVAERVPDDQLYREATAEVRVGLAALQDFRDALDAASGEDQLPGDDGAELFIADSGREYRYDRTKPLGKPGAYGTVYMGRDDKGVEVAVKEVALRPDERHRANDARQAEREVEIGHRLQRGLGEHLVPLLDVGRRETSLLLVMPVAAESLADRIQRSGPGNSEATIEIIRQIALGLQELAALNIVHRDIKPANVLMLDGRWCLSDFGTARRLDVATATLTWMGTGTLDYKAPELFTGAPELPATDLYALGCVAYEVLTGEKAFPGPDFREQHQTQVPALPDDCAPALRALILDLLCKRPGGRPADAREVVQRIAPSAGLTRGQQGLQRLRAKASQTAAAATADEAIRAQHVERQAEAAASLQAMWRNMLAEARAVDHALETDETPDLMTFTVYGAAAKMQVFPTTARVGELLLLALIDVSTDGQRDFQPTINLFSLWQNDRPRWWLARHDSTRFAEPIHALTRTTNEHTRRQLLELDAQSMIDTRKIFNAAIESATATRLLELIVDSMNPDEDQHDDDYFTPGNTSDKPPSA